MNKHIFFLLSHINYGYSRRLIYIDIRRIRSSILLCKLLSKEGIISFFILISKKKKKFIRIFLNNDYLNEFNYNSLKNYFFLNLPDDLSFKVSTSSTKPYNSLTINSKPSHLSFLKIKSIKKLNNFNKIYILSTNLGYITDRDAIHLNVGGTLICTINL